MALFFFGRTRLPARPRRLFFVLEVENMGYEYIYIYDIYIYDIYMIYI